MLIINNPTLIWKMLYKRSNMVLFQVLLILVLLVFDIFLTNEENWYFR
jgi:hypothetical protein